MELPCPFVYAKGRKCKGNIIRVEAYRADLTWTLKQDGSWRFDWQPGTHFHMFCSEKGNHSGYIVPDSEQMKSWTLPPEIEPVS
jgi:hypothetical protein